MLLQSILQFISIVIVRFGASKMIYLWVIMNGYQLHNTHVASNANVRFVIATCPPSLHYTSVVYGFQWNLEFILARIRNMHQSPTNKEKLNQNTIKFSNAHLMEYYMQSDIVRRLLLIKVLQHMILLAANLAIIMTFWKVLAPILCPGSTSIWMQILVSLNVVPI